jgi:hypothetical protein
LEGGGAQSTEKHGWGGGQHPWMIKLRKLEAGLLGKRLSQRCKINIKENVFLENMFARVFKSIIKM